MSALPPVDPGSGALPGPCRPVPPPASAPVYGISVAAELAECGVQALRLYEQRGLVTPARSAAGTRRYSLDNVHQARRIAGLLGTGLNLAGIAQVFALEAENAALRAQIAQLMADAGGVRD
ncbi:MAG: MerR family transcriptional regulator [Sporichthyaceae bacterium]